MTIVALRARDGWASFRRALIVTRREVRDTWRDWRLVIPICLLTIVFPALMQFTANVAQRWVMRWGAPLIGERILPFLLMIVGFFPISFSLVIALETFVGEKERHSLEPLLATPLTDGELYWGKMMAALITPLGAAYLGLTVYLVGLFFSLHWMPPLKLLVQILLLTTAEALVMVSGAVVISSQTTSVRAANILASFVIIPMALLVQVESVIMFWANYDVLWWFVVALVAADLLLVRMGVHLFNREELLGRDIDQLDLKKAWRQFVAFFLHDRVADEGHPFSLGRVYRRDIPAILKDNALPICVVLIAQVVAFVLGWAYAYHYPLPPGTLNLDVPEGAFQNAPQVGFLPSFDIRSVLLHNLRVLVLAAVLGLFSFGTMAVVLLMAPMGIIGFFAAQIALLGANPWLFILTFVLPHGIVELPAAIVATALSLRLGAVVVSPPSGMSLSKGVLLALADLLKVFLFLVVPLLGVAAVLEVQLTPLVVTWVW